MTTIVSASTGKNLELALKLQSLLQEKDVQVELVNLVELDLPLYTSEREILGMPSSAVSLAEMFSQATDFIFVAPEYNGSLPPVLNNAIAWVSRSGGEDWRAAFSGKIAAVATHSGGGNKVLSAMRSQLEHLGVTVLARQIHTHYQKELNPDSARAVIDQLQALRS
ncbi:MAG: NAD(P)H-dependent oxidoreductase [Planctomycetes bacterium]|nr:NAD(P)H-dependent oxidoreductase [Planctomycetota bacterium]